MSSIFGKYWPFIVIFLFVFLIISGAILAAKRTSSSPIEIILHNKKTSIEQTEIFVNGAVANSGFYTIHGDESLESIIQSAGLLPDIDITCIKIYVQPAGETPSPQKISLNRAESWLLQTLPGIGEGRAQAIIAYREQNGNFRRIDDIVKVGGIGSGTFEKIKDFITVEE